MPMKVNLGLSRKVGEPDFGSHGASVNIELEVDAAEASDAAKLRQRIRGLFGLSANRSMRNCTTTGPAIRCRGLIRCRLLSPRRQSQTGRPRVATPGRPPAIGKLGLVAFVDLIWWGRQTMATTAAVLARFCGRESSDPASEDLCGRAPLDDCPTATLPRAAWSIPRLGPRAWQRVPTTLGNKVNSALPSLQPSHPAALQLRQSSNKTQSNDHYALHKDILDPICIFEFVMRKKNKWLAVE